MDRPSPLMSGLQMSDQQLAVKRVSHFIELHFSWSDKSFCLELLQYFPVNPFSSHIRENACPRAIALILANNSIRKDTTIRSGPHIATFYTPWGRLDGAVEKDIVALLTRFDWIFPHPFSEHALEIWFTFNFWSCRSKFNLKFAKFKLKIHLFTTIHHPFSVSRWQAFTPWSNLLLIIWNDLKTSSRPPKSHKDMFSRL